MSRFALRDYRDLITGSAVILGAVAMFVASANLKDFAAIGVGASFMPRLTALLLFIVGLVIAASTWRTGGRNREPLKAEAAEPGVFGGLPAVLLSMVLMFIYLALLDPLGFLLSSVLYAFAQMIVLTKDGNRRYGLFGLCAVLTAIAAYYLFVNVFDISLPAGLLD